MGGGRQVPQREQQRPAEVTVPRLTEEETRRRATAAFDASVATVMRAQFSQAPPPAEITAIRNEVNARIRRNENVDMTTVLESYVANNPNSTIARYFNASNGASDWMVLPGNRVGFNASAFTTNIRTALIAARQPFIDTLARLSDPRNRTAPVDLSNLVARLPNTVPALAQQLATQCSSGSNSVPVTVTYEAPEQRLMLASRLPVPDQEVTIQGKNKQRKS